MNLRYKPIKSIIAWFDSQETSDLTSEKINLTRIVPFILMHVAVLAVIWVGFSWFALIVAVVMYLVRMFAITGFYHRYFSHKNFKTSRSLQFVFALIAASAAQRGPLWWASHHRIHHATADSQEDPHSPRFKGMWWSHTLWFLAEKNFNTRFAKVKDLVKFPELVWLDRFDIVAPALLALSLFVLGSFLQVYQPQLETTGWQLLVWGFFISTVFLYHATYTINSLAHRLGSRRFHTLDDSRNNFFLALLTLGEGWHNNHHYYSGTVRQGFYWWEVDVTYYLLKLMSYFGLVWELKPISLKIQQELQEKLS